MQAHVLPGIASCPPGIHANIPAEIYHRRELGVVNKGALDQLARTPAHYRAWIDGAEQEETPALVFGRALHALVLEPSLFAHEWALRPDFGDLRTKVGKESRDAWQAEHEGVTVLPADDWTRLHAMRDAVMAHPVAGKLFDGGMSEATAVWIDRRTGLLCKARFDQWRDDLLLIGDLKSTEDASPGAFSRSIARYRYHVQDAHYSAGAAALGFPARFVFVAVEKTAPFAVGVHMLDVESASRGEELRAREMDLLNECLRTDTWPGYPDQVNTIALPNWAFSD
jgi:exodeoxyribonuclease VIII